MSACAAGRQHENGRGRSQIRSHCEGGGRSGARVRRRAFGRAWRRAGAQSFHAEDVRAGTLRGFSHHQADVRSERNFQSGQDRGQPADHRESSLRRRLCDARIRARIFDYSEYGGMGGAVEMCSGLGACRKTMEGTMCPSYMATKEESHTTRGRANVLRHGYGGEAGRSRSGRSAAFTTCSTFAWNAGPAKRSVRWASIWRGSRANFWRNTGKLTGRHCTRRCSAMFAPLRNWLSPGGSAADHMLLNDGNFFWRHFNAEVAAGHHDSVGGFENFLQMIDGLRLFQLGDHRNVAVVRGDDLL